MTAAALTGLLAALGCALASYAVPRAIARIPEHETETGLETDIGPENWPKPGPEDLAPRRPLPSFAEVAASPGLAWRTAVGGAVAGGAVGLALGATWLLLVVLPLVPIGVLLTVVDWRTQLLPKAVVVPAYAVTIAACLATAVITGDYRALLGALIGWAVLGGLYFVLWFIYPPGMGYGDVRLAGILGIALGFLGYTATAYGLLLGMLLGGLGSVLLAALRLVDRRNCPYGPFLLIGAWAGVVLAGSL